MMSPERFRSLCQTIDSNSNLYKLSTETREDMLKHLGKQGISTWNLFILPFPRNSHANYPSLTKSSWLCNACYKGKSSRATIYQEATPITDVTEIFRHLETESHQESLIMWKLAK